MTLVFPLQGALSVADFSREVLSDFDPILSNPSADTIILQQCSCDACQRCLRFWRAVSAWRDTFAEAERYDICGCGESWLSELSMSLCLCLVRLLTVRALEHEITCKVTAMMLLSSAKPLKVQLRALRSSSGEHCKLCYEYVLHTTCANIRSGLTELGIC